MRTISAVLCFAAIVLSCTNPCLGFDIPLFGNSDHEYIWYSSDAPKIGGAIVDEGPQEESKEENGLWITDTTGEETRKSLEIPRSAWAKLMLAPSDSGELKLYCLYPTGTAGLLFAEEVEEGHSYGAWYYSELEGDYEVWYTLNGSKSNSIKFHVRKVWVGDEVAAGVAPPTGGWGGSGGGKMHYVVTSPAPSPVSKSASGSSIGFAAGGAKDVNNFRENIDQDFLPLSTDVTYEGLFYDYYFDTGEAEECEKLFCPSYSSAISKDPISGEPQHYLSVGLNSGISDFERKKLNLVVVLDYSGSMGSSFDEYYYDRFGNKVVPEYLDDSRKTKMEIANEAVVDLLDHLEEEDRFGMVIFSNDAFLVEPLTKMEDKNLNRLKSHILDIEDYSGTNMEAGMVKGTKLLEEFLDVDPLIRENRIIFLTDAMPNLGTRGEGDLLSILEENANQGVYTTIIGIGLDFNTELVDAISKVRGANYYSVHSAGEFEERMDEEFDFMVTPLVFDLQLNLDSDGYQIKKVYGSPEADEATGEIMKVNTLFPSKSEEGAVKGGMILIKLKQLSPDGRIALKVSYEDRNGTKDSDEAQVAFPEVEPDFYQNNGIRKAVLLTRYADLIKNWIADERRALESEEQIEPSVTREVGILVPVPIVLCEWERQSLPLQVSKPYAELFGEFGSYFEEEREAIGDVELQQEEVVLEKLSSYSA